MAASSSSSSQNDLLDDRESEVAFQHYYTEVKEIEKRDSVLTPKQQIDRLLRPGSTYFNLNPFEEPLPPKEEMSECSLKTHQFSAKILDMDIHFSVLQLKDSFFLWIGAAPVLSQLAVAMPSRFDKTPISTHLIGANADSASAVIAARLAKRTTKQVFVCYSLDPTDKRMLSHVEERLAEEIRFNSDKF